ncbi:TraR/DksA family transcriptional regulator [Stakelama marina]|uniref:TraR/DksA C4-type zinc finger protein n=1 Tax=Stakelama marina TaxID=2826939 RepID=A0A8T4IJR6_9SPHN|nr:TraR/DksA C4-type zinc finger protein [Stakelama marina]MBR0553365.1 TraR/DksA C4-type zinc finger protein [Stakelama marina]
MEDWSDADLDRFRARLIERRAELVALDRGASESRAAVTLDQQSVGRLSRMDAMQQQAMAQAEGRRRQQEIVRIDNALSRIEQGEFGWCVECGDAIAAKRIEFDPSAARCLDCSA